MISTTFQQENTHFCLMNLFRRFSHSREKRLWATSCLSFCVYQRGTPWTDFRKIWHGGRGAFMKICRETPNFTKIGRKYRALYIKRTYFVILPATWQQILVRLSVFCTLLKLTRIQRYKKKKASLSFHCKNGYRNVSQCYVMRTLPFVFVLCTSLAIFPHHPSIVPQIFTVFSLSFHFHGKSQALHAPEGVILYSASFHRCYWSRKTAS